MKQKIKKKLKKENCFTSFSFSLSLTSSLLISLLWKSFVQFSLKSSSLPFFLLAL